MNDAITQPPSHSLRRTDKDSAGRAFLWMPVNALAQELEREADKMELLVAQTPKSDPKRENMAVQLLDLRRDIQTRESGERQRAATSGGTGL